MVPKKPERHKSCQLYEKVYLHRDVRAITSLHRKCFVYMIYYGRQCAIDELILQFDHELCRARDEFDKPIQRYFNNLYTKRSKSQWFCLSILGD